MADLYWSADPIYPPLFGDVTGVLFKSIWSPGYALPFADLAELKADPTYGDGNLGDAFDPGQYVNLADGSKAYYDGLVWQAGVAPEGVAVQQGVTPCSNPKAFTIPQVKSYIENDAADPCQCAADALLLEQEGPGSSRATLVTWLEDYIAVNCTPGPGE